MTALVVVWADPGVTTGWAVVRVPVSVLLEKGQVGSVSVMWWRVGQFRCSGTSDAVDSFLNLCRAVWDKSQDDDLVVLGAEGFSLGMLSRDEALLEPVRFLAVIRDRLRGTGVGLEVQMPSQRTIVTDEMLKLWGLWSTGTEHGRQALKHALVFLRRFLNSQDLRGRLGYEEAV